MGFQGSSEQLRDTLWLYVSTKTAHLPVGLIIECVVVFTIFFGVIFGFAYSTGAFTATVKQQKDDLKKMGYTVSSSGVAIKTDKAQRSFEDEADRAQRKMAKTATSGAITFRAGAGAGGPAPVDHLDPPQKKSTKQR